MGTDPIFPATVSLNDPCACAGCLLDRAGKIPTSKHLESYMPRPARLVLEGVPLHIVHRGNNRQTCFHSNADYIAYLNWLAQYSRAAGCAVHAYVLMTNHVHLLISFPDVAGPAMLMKALAQRYSQHFNWLYQRTGTLWEGRYHSSLVDNDKYFLICQQYIELNPVRAGMVAWPFEYRWSSHRGNAGLRHDGLLTQHGLFRSLGTDDAECQQKYRALFAVDLNPAMVDHIRKCTRANRALSHVAKPRGRPPTQRDGMV